MGRYLTSLVLATATFLIVVAGTARAHGPNLQLEQGTGLTPAGLAASMTKGLPAGTSLPSWAANKSVHFMPTASAGPVTTPVSPRNRRHRAFLGRICETGYCPTVPLLYKGGAGVQHSPKIYVIFWGSNWTKSPGLELHAQLLEMYEGLSNSSYQSILTQYFDTTGRVGPTVSVKAYTDSSVAAPSLVSDTKIREEVSSAIGVNGWPRESNSQFIVIPAPSATFASGFDTGFCGYHGVDAKGSSYSFVAYAGEEPFKGCRFFDEALNANHATSMVAAHEYAESATNPNTASVTWRDSEEFEVADICASSDSELPNGTWVQGLWDDHQSACSLSDVEPPHVYAVTNPATGIGDTSATLKGTLNTENLETSYLLEYGTTTAYGTGGGGLIAAGTSNVPVNLSIIGSLVPEVTYHFRLRATNSTGTTYGEDQIFKTTSQHWEVRSTPQLEPSPNHFYNVSCTASSACTVVGDKKEMGEEGGGPTIPLAERWNGTEWKVQTAAKPSGASASTLSGVSCVSGTSCEAVGYLVNGTGIKEPLAEVWNGSTWSIQTTPHPTGASGTTLSDISCTASSACTGVGSYTSGSSILTLAERWNGSTWSIQSTPNPSESKRSELAGVSCTSGTACIAVGTWYNGSGTNATLAEVWNGSSWSFQTIPSGSKGGTLFDLSCSNASSCIAVGGYSPTSAQIALVERWNGTEWAIQSSPSPPGAERVALRGVYCISSSECTAVGYSVPTSGLFYGWATPLAEHWNGTSWGMQEPPVPSFYPESTPFTGLFSVACISSSECTAAGYSVSEIEAARLEHTLVERAF